MTGDAGAPDRFGATVPNSVLGWGGGGVVNYGDGEDPKGPHQSSRDAMTVA